VNLELAGTRHHSRRIKYLAQLRHHPWIDLLLHRTRRNLARMPPAAVTIIANFPATLCAGPLPMNNALALTDYPWRPDEFVSRPAARRAWPAPPRPLERSPPRDACAALARGRASRSRLPARDGRYQEAPPPRLPDLQRDYFPSLRHRFRRDGNRARQSNRRRR